RFSRDWSSDVCSSDLSVFGYVDALRQAPRLIRTWRDTRRRTLEWRPDVFVGVDAPDFNLRLEEKLRAAGIPTVHFVGPSIWAWRSEERRVGKEIRIRG